MPTLELPIIEDVPIKTDTDVGEENATETAVREEKTVESADEMITIFGVEYLLSYVRGYLRIRFCIPRTFNAIDVLPQGIVVTIPDKGHEKNSCEIGLRASYEDSGGVQVQKMTRSKPQEPWNAHGKITRLRDPENIPVILARMMQEVNWNVLEKMDMGKRVIVD